MSGATKSTTNIILSVVAVILVVCFGIVLFLDNMEQKAEYAKNLELSSQAQVERREKLVELEKRESTDSFYQKLVDGFDVNILVVGDSIGLGKGVEEASLSWIELMRTTLIQTYNVNVSITNVSLGYSTSYAGFVRTMSLEDNQDFDLAIVCYGQYDDDKYFGVFYEGLIRTLRREYECSVISVLEASQRDYTDKIKTIKDISEHYGSQVADVIAPFKDKENGGYAALTSENGIDPNEAGHRIYADIITRVMMNEADNGTAYYDADVEIMNDWIINLENFQGISSLDFKRTDNRFVYTVNDQMSGIFGISYKYMQNKNSCRIFIDGKEYKVPSVSQTSEYMQLYVVPIKNTRLTAKSTIEVRFDNEEQANGFKGVCVSWPDSEEE